MIRTVADGVLLDILVRPRAAHARVGPVHGERLKVAVTAPPADGAANDAVLALLAKHLGRPRRDLCLVGGQSSRRKTVHVAGMDRLAVVAALGIDHDYEGPA
ncbi:DUF167 domain-containing protein [Haliangium ochraceum]|uniref:UPF0235 protein Hoch_4719 n=1 Tax=Haliangium ochraceum (strain DSM 14365 / JCM 11303 / SMP-2) TaxID=502025 RepID=D0LRI1_HALO1|nr:DUF167 domain-containing protein [Haliangium ochraceum]ACY17209.1 protein of unknown function DUF167 [Haliangium ochraceum DSM 14365]